jgi:uncharacterized glyoxalase superfamily protein PhnB
MTEPPTIYPVLRYRDARRAIRFLAEAFGFEEVMVVTGPSEEVVHAELRLGDAVLLLGEGGAGASSPPPGQDFATADHSVYVVVGDVDAHAARARAAGADIFREPADTGYGSREYAARDLDDHLWSFGTYVPAAQPSSAV